MPEGLLFDIAEHVAPAPEAVRAAITPATEAEMCALLAQRYTSIAFGSWRYAFAAHVPNRPVSPSRVADFIAVDCWESSVRECCGDIRRGDRATNERAVASLAEMGAIMAIEEVLSDARRAEWKRK
jgi:hypothetical protein